IGLMIGDIFQFFLGRHTGWALLGFLCRLSMNPETCMLRSAESFYKRGKLTLVIAKFVPGINTMAAPLAGSMKMRFSQFLRLDFLGALLYSVTYLLIGFVSRDFLAVTLNSFRAAGRAMEIVIIAILIVYAVYRVTQMLKYRKYNVVPRVQAAQLEAILTSPDAIHVQIVDVRSHGYYDVGAERILGSIRIEPNNLDEEVKALPKDKDIYVYCTCARDATSAKVAHLLRERGFNAFVIVGGLAAWRKAGGHFESIPKSDLVKLPTFA
ncbi:MAG: rhodanese-like domain-containing protein, partial [Candidatus Sulfotelmatobacter sp.]